jgi:hypothetical protein
MDDVVLPRETAVGLVKHLKAALLSLPVENEAYSHVFRTLIVIERGLADPEARIYLADE